MLSFIQPECVNSSVIGGIDNFHPPVPVQHPLASVRDSFNAVFIEADAVGELVNMISGAAKAKFEGKNVSISCPSVVIGKGHKVAQPSDAVCITIPFDCPAGQFSVEIAIKSAKAAANPTSQHPSSAKAA